MCFGRFLLRHGVTCSLRNLSDPKLQTATPRVPNAVSEPARACASCGDQTYSDSPPVRPSPSSSPPRFPELPVLHGAEARTGRFFIPSTRGCWTAEEKSLVQHRRKELCQQRRSERGRRATGGQANGRTDADTGRSGSRRTLGKKRTGE